MQSCSVLRLSREAFHGLEKIIMVKDISNFDARRATRMSDQAIQWRDCVEALVAQKRIKF